MATVISPTNPGVVYDPRMRARSHYLEAVQRDLDVQTKDFNPTGDKVGKDLWKPMPDNLFTPDGKPNPALRGFSPGRTLGFGGFIGVLGGVRRIG